MPSIPNSMAEIVSLAIRNQIEKIVKEEADEAVKRVHSRVRENVGAIASSVLDHFTFENYGRELRIRVDFDSQNNPVR